MSDEKIAPFNRNRTEAKPPGWRDRFTLTKLADIVLDAEPLWLIDGLIPAGPSLGVIFGQPKSGKSFLTADMFLHVAMGRTYAGCTVQQGAVVYITKEGVRGFKRRMMAARQHHHAGPQVPFYVAHEMPNFGTDNGDADDLVALIQRLAPHGVPVAAVIIDTLARSMPGQSDSEPAVMSRFVENCDTVARAFACFVGAVHHTPRSTDTRSRGSNVLDAAADVLISVVKERDERIAKIEALKDGEEGLLWRFSITEKRNQNSGCTPLCATISGPRREDATATKAQPRLTPEERRFLDILRDAVRQDGATVPAADTVPANIKVVTREHFKKCLLDKGFVDADPRNSMRAKVSKYINQLAGKKVVGTSELHIWLVKP
jgi:hypothetical protein